MYNYNLLNIENVYYFAASNAVMWIKLSYALCAPEIQRIPMVMVGACRVANARCKCRMRKTYVFSKVNFLVKYFVAMLEIYIVHPLL